LYDLLYTPSAARDMRHLPEDLRARLRDSMEALRLWPEHGADVRKLRDADLACFRLRVGDYRVLFDVDSDRQRILIVRVRHRQRAY